MIPRRVNFTSSIVPGGAFGLLRKRTFPTTEFDCDGVVVLFRFKKVKRSPEPTTTATSKAIKVIKRVLRCLAGCAMLMAGVFVSGLGNEVLPGPPPAGAVARILLSFSDEMIEGGENGDEDGAKGAGVITRGREDCSELEEFASLISRVADGLRSSEGTGMLRASATAMVMADALEKRASGSFAMLFRMTSEKAGGRSGLIRAGGVGRS